MPHKTKPPGASKEDRYLVEAVVRAWRILSVFERAGEQLTLKEIARRARLSLATAFRLLHTLEHCGAVERSGDRLYRTRVAQVARARYRFGYASEAEDPSFTQPWNTSIAEACAAENIELLTYDNAVDSSAAVANVDRMITDKVHLAIEHQLNDRAAPVVAHKLARAKIPLIAMGAAHPGAIYFGGDNYQAGLLGGRALGEFAKRRWKGRAQQLLLIELESGGPLLASRVKGMECGLLEVLPEFDLTRVVRLPSSGLYGATLQLMREHLARTRARRILVGAVNDPCALGALRALEESGWEEDCAVVGQGGSVEGRQELRRPGTRLIGTVAFFGETYGSQIVRIALDLLAGKAVPPAVFVNHCLLTRANVDHYYPNDTLLAQRPVRLD